MSELSERLREAHPNSQQYALGSNIFLEAAQEIESLQAQLSEVWEERDRLKALGNKLYVELMLWAPNILDNRETFQDMRNWENEIFHNRLFHNRQQEETER